MNEDRELTDEQLKLVTSRLLPAGASLDADVAAARDAFMSLGGAIELAASEFEEDELAEKLRRSCLESTPSDSVVLASKRPLDWWSIVLGGALAAASMIAIVRIAVISQQPSGAITVAKNEKSSASDLQLMPTFANIGWSDPLDEEIAVAAVAIERLGARRRNVDGSLLEMNDRLDALFHELSVESL